MSAQTEHPEPSHPAEHGMTLRGYFIIYLALLALLALTVAAAYLHLGIWSVLLAVTIAIVKALLVMLYFMHVRDSGRLVWLYAGVGFAWLGIMIVLTLSDYLSRGWLQG